MSSDLNHHVKRLLELYDGKANDFQRYFILLVAISLFILIFILVPFVSTQSSKVNVLGQINNTTELINRTNNTILLYKSAANGIDSLHTSLSRGTDVLIDYIKNIENLSAQSTSETSTTQSGTPNEARLLFPQCDSYVTRDQEWIECNVNLKVQSLLNEYDAILTDKIIKPLSSLDKKSKTAIGFVNLTTGVRDLEVGFNNTIAKYPKFWSTVKGKTSFFIELNNQVEGLWKKYQSKIKSENSTLANQVSNSQIQLTNLNDKLLKLNTEQENIEKRISEFDTPIGKLSAGFNDVITIFPFALAGGFLVCTSILVETMRIRRDYYKYHPKKDNGNTLYEDEVARTAPLWLDPKDDKQNKIMRVLVLLLPIIIYCVSIGVIFYSWSIAESSLGTEPYFRPVATILYLQIVVVVIIYAFYYINREYSSGKKEPVCNTILAITNATSSGANGINIEGNAIDNNASSKWISTTIVNPYIALDLGLLQYVCGIDITWADPNTHYLFDISVSNDNIAFRLVFSGARTGSTPVPEAYRFNNAQARFVKITITESTHGVAASRAEISEISVYGS
jgi:F5/8 type C domain